MAQLPPKAPTLAQKCPSFGYRPPAASQPSWPMDDFIDFSSSRRTSHRSSNSTDSIEFVETDFMINECHNSNNNESLIPCSNNNGFDQRLDDDQLSSMFTDQSTTNLKSSPTQSDHNSDNDEPKSTMQYPMQLKNEPRGSPSVKPHVSFSTHGGIIVDPKRVKRILANRQSAQRSRVRKLHYISELERSVTTLQKEVSTLSPRVAYLDHQRLILNVDNSSLKQRIAALAQDNIFKDAHQEALKKEIERLRRVYQEQNR